MTWPKSLDHMPQVGQLQQCPAQLRDCQGSKTENERCEHRAMSHLRVGVCHGSWTEAQHLDLAERKPSSLDAFSGGLSQAPECSGRSRCTCPRTCGRTLHEFMHRRHPAETVELCRQDPYLSDENLQAAQMRKGCLCRPKAFSL